MSKRFLVMLAVFALLMLPQAYAQDSEPVVLDGMPAPYSQEYLDWVNGTKRVTSGQDSESGTTVHYGLTPMPVDLSHLKKNPPKIPGLTSPLPSYYISVQVPSAYDLRAYSLLPDVRNQNPFGTCWAFSALGAMESNFMKNNPNEEVPDLSEMHLAWFVYKNPEEGKAVNTHDIGSDYEDFILDQGGNPGHAVAFLSRLAGPVKESALPYPTKSVLGLYSYDTGDRPSDGAKPEDYGSAVMRLSDASFYTDYTDVPEPNTEMRKKLIMDKGAVQIVYCNVDDSYSKGGGTTVFFNNTTGTETNHAVLIVGWDDDFPRENFPESMRPENNGAWLVRNSWGSNWADDGYFWMSYEQYIRYAVAYTVKTDSPKAYVYDDLGWTASFSYKWAANVFQAGETAEAVTEVGFYTTDNNAPYEIYVYDLGETHPGKPVPADVTEMTPIESGTMAYAGYHTAELSEPVTIPAGHYFSVVMRMDQAEDASFSSMIAVEMSDQNYPAVYHEGESYFCSRLTVGGEEVMPAGSYLSYWQDGNDTGYSINACIKAFTENAEDDELIAYIENFFPDEIFRNYVRSNFDTNNDGWLSKLELAKAKTINVSGLGIEDLTGIEYFTALTSLNCSYNRLAALDSSGFTRLEYLDCSHNAIGALNLENAPALTYTNLSPQVISYGSDNLRCTYDSNNVLALKLVGPIKLVYDGGTLGDSDGLSKDFYLFDMSYPASSPMMSSIPDEITSRISHVQAYRGSDLSYTTYFNGNMCSGGDPFSAEVFYRNSSGMNENLFVFAAAVDVRANKPEGLGYMYDTGRSDAALNVTVIFSGDVMPLPEITAETLPAAELGQNYEYQFKASGLPEVDDNSLSMLYTWGVSNNPEGLSIDSYTGLMSGIPQEAGEFKLSVYLDAPYLSALFNAGLLIEREFTLDVSEEAGAEEIAIDSEKFPDDIFRKYVLESVDLNGNGGLSEEEIAAITSIVVNDMGISSLKGIEYFTALTELECFKNNLTELDVSKNTALTVLTCFGNQLTELDITHNTALEMMDCHGNKLTSLDVSKNVAFRDLDCSANDLAELDVSKNIDLTHLWCHYNELTELDVTQNISLTYLRCRGNQLIALDVSSNSNLTQLYCDDNQLTALNVSKNSALTMLHCYNNKLTSLTLGNNSVLNTLLCQNNSLTEIDITRCPLLYDSNNFVYDDGVTILTDSLAISSDTFPDTYFRAYISDKFDTDGNGLLSDSEIEAATSISIVPGSWIPENFKSLEGIQYLTSLTSLKVTHSYITSIDVSVCPSLRSIELAANGKLTAVTLGSLPNLKTLVVNNSGNLSNGFNALDISGCPALTYLDCSSNQISELDLSNNPELAKLICSDNKISVLDISKNPYLILAQGSKKLVYDDGVTIIDGTSTIAPAFKNANLILSGQIGVNFYLDLPAISGVDYYDGNSCYMVFDINGDSTGNNPQTTDGSFKLGELFGYRCYINSVQMADPITADFHYGNDKTVSYVYTVKRYLDNKIKDTSNPSMQKLAAAIKDYGHYAQLFLSRVNNWKLGVKHVELEAANDYTEDDLETVRSVIDAYKPVRDDYTGTGISGVTYSLELAAETTINLIFKMDSGYSGNVFASLNGGSQNMAVRQSDGTYRVQISGISAHRLGDTQTVKVTAAKDFTIKVSALTFSYISLNGADKSEDRQNLGAALYNYYKCSIDFKNSN